MKALKPWQKWVLRLTGGLAKAIIGLLLVLAVSTFGSLLLNILFLPKNEQFAEQANAGDLLACILLSQYSIYWLVPSFILSLFITYRLFGLEMNEYYLPKVGVQEAQVVIKDNPEFADTLDPLIQDAIATDDGRRLAEKIQKIRDLLLLKKRLAYKREDLADLEKEIAKKEKELTQK